MSKKNLFVAALTFVAAIAVIIPFIGRAEDSRSSLPQNLATSELKAKEVAPISSADDEPRVVSLHVSPDGFEPAETIVPRGKVLILLQNRSGNRDLSFYLLRENQERLAESDPQRRDWKARVQLGPGTYIVGEISHPEWQSIIRVTN
jgi:hypothetical protein